MLDKKPHQAIHKRPAPAPTGSGDKTGFNSELLFVKMKLAELRAAEDVSGATLATPGRSLGRLSLAALCHAPDRAAGE